MKTLVVFSTLTALAVAIPTLSGKQLEKLSLIQNKQTAKRNTESFNSELKTPNMGFVSESNENQERTFLKKKLLLKKSRKFRDTEEEAKSESQEKTTMKSEGTQCHEQKSHEWELSELHQPVKAISEALKHLQGVINKQEEENKMSELKTGKSRNAEDESEGELDETVKKAKEALEQIESKIGNLEELHFRTASLNNAASAHEQLKEEERLAQWKEAMENIHRNVEIARNLEDKNFKSESLLSGPMVAKSDVADQKFEKSNNMQFGSDDEKMKSGKHFQEVKSSWHHDELKTDMKAAVEGAMEPALMKSDEHMDIKGCTVQDKDFIGPHTHRKHSAPAKNSAETMEKKSNQLNEPKNKSDENKSDSSSQESEKLEQQMSNNKENQLKGDEENKKGSSLDKENKPTMEMGHNKTKSDSEKKLDDHMMKIEGDSHVAPSNQMVNVLKPETKAESGTQNLNKTTEAKAENIQPPESQTNSMSQQSRFSQQESMRSSDGHESQSQTEHGQDFNSFMKASDEHNQRFHSMKQNIHHENPLGSHGMMPQGRSAEMANSMWDSTSDMRSAPIHNRWQELHRSRGAYGPSLGYGTPPPISGSASSSSATTSGGSGSGTVGVFPNAKVGECGIPLLLSCSPSVVSGTLSKASSYSAPAYRGESKHFNFHNKRDTKKVDRFPSHVKKGTTTILESLH